MGNWSNHILTKRGRELRAKVESGRCKLSITKMKIGDGGENIGEIEQLTDLRSPKLILSITHCAVSEADANICNVTAIASSENVDNSFLVTELGLYADDPDIGEILYMVGLDSIPDTIPNKNSSAPVTLTYQMNIVSSNAANITAMIDPAGIVTVKRMEQKIKEHNEDASAHANLGLHIRKNSTAYAVGDIAYSRALPSWARLECVKAGTTASTDNEIKNIISKTGG
ncbi:phage tail-collar fiber domain-containing protein [Selenomonas sp. F0473]|uniref:phage tail-collar fiber domain-containing protein n=1 Tax=Selenomonas sp. F0473 TaxID=999423 RepID=UPI0025F77B5F|nr:phage tail protein [Selenomonas sp. F0473]